MYMICSGAQWGNDRTKTGPATTLHVPGSAAVLQRARSADLSAGNRQVNYLVRRVNVASSPATEPLLVVPTRTSKWPPEISPRHRGPHTGWPCPFVALTHNQSPFRLRSCWGPSGKLVWGQTAKAGVRPAGIIVEPPGFNDPPCHCKPPNTCSLRHSLRKRPLRLSTKAFWTGCPARCSAIRRHVPPANAGWRGR